MLRYLPASARKNVALVAVATNPAVHSLASVRAFDQEQGLGEMKNWYFLTGPTSALKAVWKTYGIEVIVPKNATQTVHADYLYFIDPRGQERYLASPQVDQRKNGTGYLPQGQLTQWGQGIATYLEKTLTR